MPVLLSEQLNKKLQHLYSSHFANHLNTRIGTIDNWMVLTMENKENETTTGRKSIVSDITASGIFGILNTSFMVSYATLIFAKTCPDYFGTAVALLLLGACTVSILLELMSTYPGTIGSSYFCKYFCNHRIVHRADRHLLFVVGLFQTRESCPFHSLSGFGRISRSYGMVTFYRWYSGFHRRGLQNRKHRCTYPAC